MGIAAVIFFLGNYVVLLDGRIVIEGVISKVILPLSIIDTVEILACLVAVYLAVNIISALVSNLQLRVLRKGRGSIA